MVEVNRRDGGRPIATHTRGTPEQTGARAGYRSKGWLQTISMSHARMQAESIAQWIGTCQRA